MSDGKLLKCVKKLNWLLKLHFKQEIQFYNSYPKINGCIFCLSIVPKTVILLILEKENAGLLMQAAKRMGIGNNYVWVGTDGWTGRGSVAMVSLGITKYM